MSNVVITFAIEKLMRVFFEKRKTSFLCMTCSYLLYFVLSSLAFLLLNMPMVNILIGFATLFLISLNYESSIIKKLSSAICSLVLFMVADALVFVLFNIANTSFWVGAGHEETSAHIFVALSAFTTATVLQKFKNIRRNPTTQPVMYWVAILFIPLSSFALVMLIIFSTDTSQIAAAFIVAIIFAVNLFTLYLNDGLSKAYEVSTQSALHEKEKEYYSSQCQLMQESVDKVKAIRHDMKIHLGAMQGFSVSGKTDDIVGYLEQLWGSIKESEIYSNTGNLSFDSIINHNFRDVPEKKIALEMEINIPPVLNIETADVVTILGNLLSNALEAVEKVDKKWIKLTIALNKGTLFIKVDNPFDGKMNFADGREDDLERIMSSKRKSEIGLGLKNIKRSVMKYNGEMNVSCEGNVFSVSILLYVDVN